MTVAELNPHFDEQVLRPAYGRSFTLLCALLAVFGLVSLIQFAVEMPSGAWEQVGPRMWGRLAGVLAAVALPVGAAWWYRKQLETPKRFTAAVTTLILLMGVVLLASRMLVQKQIAPLLPAYVAWGLLDIVVMHLIVCLFGQWSARETVVPFVPLLLIWALAMLLPHPEWKLDVFDRVVAVIASPIALVPGAAVAAWREKRRGEDRERILLGRQVRSIGSELSRARIVHDAMFPRAIDEGHIGFEYEYQPIAEIGGDYVHLCVCPRTGRTYLTLLDVAGHGLAAALTVNRLFGELERIRAENPDAEPGDVMVLLNRYVHLTMAGHSMFATGACIMIDPRLGELKWVNAGHPPAFIRRVTGEVADLDGTSMLLGPLAPDEYDPGQKTVRMRPGDVVIAYTDGAFEARDRGGRQFGIDRLRETACFNPPPRSWPRFIANAVQKHHEGRAEDDVLIASLTLRSLRIDEPETREVRAILSRMSSK